jgi:hypothetical protein
MPHQHHVIILSFNHLHLNKKVSLFNQICIQESSSRQSRADDVMVLETAKQRYKNPTGSKFNQIQSPPLVGSCEASTQVEGKVGWLIHNGSISLLK